MGEKALERLSYTFADGKYISIDFHTACSSCGATIDTAVAHNRLKRLANVHTLPRGTLEVSITDVRCPVCNRSIPSYGADNAVLCLEKRDDFAGELLDAQVWDVFGLGAKLRDGFSSWMLKTCVASAEFHRIGFFSSLNRQRANEAFTSFLMTLRLPRENNKHQLFSCDNCQK